MKVCYVTHLPNLTGANQSLLDLLRSIEDSNVEPIVLLGRHGPLEKELKTRGIPYKVIRYGNELKKDNSVLHTIRKDILNLFALPCIVKFFKDENVEMVHNNSMFVGIGMLAAKILGIPFIAHIRDYVEEDHGLRLEHLGRQSKLVQSASRTIAVSKALSSAASTKYGITSVEAIYDGIDVGRYFQPIKNEIQSAWNSETPLELLLAGRISKGKGQLDAVRALTYLSIPVHLTLVGTVADQAYEKAIYAEIEKLPQGSVTVLPFAEDLAELRKNANVCLVCSSSEAMGRVTIESMLAGCFVIGAKGGATPELLEQGRGYLYEPGNARELALCIGQYATLSPETLHTILKNNQNYAMNSFSLSRYGETILKLYKGVFHS